MELILPTVRYQGPPKISPPNWKYNILLPLVPIHVLFLQKNSGSDKLLARFSQHISQSCNIVCIYWRQWCVWEEHWCLAQNCSREGRHLEDLLETEVLYFCEPHLHRVNNLGKKSRNFDHCISCSVFSAVCWVDCFIGSKSLYIQRCNKKSTRNSPKG